MEATVEFVKANDARAAPFQQPLTEFLDGEPRIWGPVLLCVALAVVLGRRLLANDLPARLGQFVIAYLAFVWFYRLAVTSAVIETWWAYNMVAISTCFAVPLILDQLVRSLTRRAAQLVVAAAVAATAGVSILLRYQNADAVALYERIRDNVPALVVLLAVGIASAVAMKLLRPPAARAVSAGALFGVVAFISLTPARYIGTGQTGEFGADGRAELRAYDAAYDMAKLLEEVDQPDRRSAALDDVDRLAGRELDEPAPPGRQHQRPGEAIAGVASTFPRCKGPRALSNDGSSAPSVSGPC